MTYSKIKLIIATVLSLIVVNVFLCSYSIYDDPKIRNNIFVRGGQEYKHLSTDGEWYRVTTCGTPVFSNTSYDHDKVGYIKYDARVYGQKVDYEWIKIGDNKYVYKSFLTEWPDYRPKGNNNNPKIVAMDTIKAGCEIRYIDREVYPNKYYYNVDDDPKTQECCWFRVTKKLPIIDEPDNGADTVGFVNCDAMVFSKRGNDSNYLKIGPGKYVKKFYLEEIDNYVEKTKAELDYYSRQKFLCVKAEREFQELKNCNWYKVSEPTKVYAEPVGDSYYDYRYEHTDVSGILKRDAMVRAMPYVKKDFIDDKDCYKIGEGKYVSKRALDSCEEYIEKTVEEIERIEKFDVSNIIKKSGEEYWELQDPACSWYAIINPNGTNIYDDTSDDGEFLGLLRDGAMVYAKSCDERNWLKIGTGKFIYSGDAQEVPDYKDIATRAREKAIRDAKVKSVTIQGVSPIVVKAIYVCLFIVFSFLSLKRIYIKTKGRFWGTIDDNGMKRTFFCRKEPYANITKICLSIVASAIVALIAMFVIGFALFGLFIALSYICRTFVATLICIWLLYIIFCIIPKPSASVKMLFVVFPIVLSLVTYLRKEDVAIFADSCYESGVNLMHSFNVYEFFVDNIVDYLIAAMILAIIPLVLFLAIAAIWMIFAYVLRLYDWATTKIYNVRNPCPSCQENSEPAIYLSKMEEDDDNNIYAADYMQEALYYPLPTKLRPGIYGLFHIKHPNTGEKMSTLLMNGRTKHARQCKLCNYFISSEAGTNKHIAMIGWPGSGKSALGISILANIMRANVKITLSEDVDPEIKDVIYNIRNIGYITSDLFPQKTRDGRLPSIRVNIPRIGRPDYALYLDDVAGESFDTYRENGESLSFLYNTTSLIFIIDPFTCEFSNLGPNMKVWMKKHLDDTYPAGKVDDLFDSLRTRIHQINRLNKMVINFVLVKTDSGYLGDVNITDESAIENFIRDELGLISIINNNEFKEKHFYAVSTMSHYGGVSQLTQSILDQQDIKNW